MKNLKKLLIVAILFLLCGCSVEYNLTINSDSTVSEKVVAKEYSNKLKTLTGLDKDKAVDYLYNSFNRSGLDSKISTKEENGNTISTVIASHKTIDDYINSFSSDIFTVDELTRKDDAVSLKFNQIKKIGNSSVRGSIYDNIEVKITVPFEVVSHNATSKRGSTYIWKIDKKTNPGTIEISYKENKKQNEVKVDIGNKSFSIKYEYIALAIFVVIILIIAVVVYVKNKKNNRID